ncbi:hypothetical protein DSM106972_005700 [Dulcicalothrix desertica PCC 7102]|uniref:Uncharacterized protein n=1 Tax=Dulcicalothrix desertica PCC 7102 TaxID=232991 RepID=A0A3S1AVD9_9CYAN|nr:hypothetical protein [Dulcicalothrix desertica]RUT10075.1 hypothetical protein DSM106972_005700 [Dulcicalothrix desertica PCC 7102]TWH40947.1 hypothetical protein CAL7102_10310 [Dulcicalothrix desertica PCC 7102]
MAERLESLKAAILASFGAIFAFTIINLIQIKFSIFSSTFDLHWWLSAAIVLFSGFLFGVTYRYIIRDDNNFQLKAGGVMAFAVVRGLVQADTKLAMVSDINDIFSLALPLAVLLAENVFLFGLAAILLDVAIQNSWIKAFKSES